MPLTQQSVLPPTIGRLRVVATALVTLLTATSTAVAQGLPTPQNFRATVESATVVLLWNQINAQYRFRIEAGSAPGLTDIASFSTPMMAAAHYFTVQNVPSGTYYVRLRTELDGQLGAPSNEAVVTVAGCSGVPAPPSIQADVNAQLVVVQWTLPTFPAGCAPSSLRLEAGHSPGASDALTMNVTDWNFTRREFASVPFGTYYLRMRADRFGVVGGPSNEVRLDIGCLPPPSILNPQATVIGNAARFSWGYNAGPSADFAVSLEAGSQPGATDIAAIPVPSLAFTGFNVAGAEGHYYTRLRASNACGTTVSAEMPVRLTSTCVPPEPIPFVDAGMALQNTTLQLRWDPPAVGGLVTTYDVQVGTAPGQSNLARRTVDGRYTPPVGYFNETFNVAAQRAYLTITPHNACGAARPAEVYATNAAGCTNPPAPRVIDTQVNGSTVTLWWSGTSEFERYRTYVEIGSSPGASDEMTSPITDSYPPPSFQAALAPGRYYARARWLPMQCNEVSNPSPEISFVVP